MRLARALLPREPSTAGMLVLSGLGGLALAGLSPGETAVGGLLLLLHLASFEAGFESARRGRWGRLALVTAVNAAPYACAVLASLMPSWLFTAGAFILGVQALLHYRLGARSPATYVWGALVPVLPGLFVPSALGRLAPKLLVFWALMSLYSVSTALYVESRLPWRRVPPWAPLLLWAPAPAIAAGEPLALVALAEPSAKLVVNAVRNSKIEPSAVRRLGLREQIRLTLFFALLLAALLSS